MKIAMTEHVSVRSFRSFVAERLPAALAAVAPLSDYRVEETAPGAGRVSFSLVKRNRRVSLAFDGLPFPREDGSFSIDGAERAVVMTATSNDLEQAEIRAVGEQLIDHIGPRLAAPPAEAEWDESVLRAWLPLDRWLREFLRESETSQFLDSTNPLARLTHLRRIYISGPDASFHPSQIGRVCPVETPEGPNMGIALTLATGADVRDGRIVPNTAGDDGLLGPSASLVPLLCHDDPSRALMAVNMMRQWLPQGEPELPLVRSGHEPEDGTLSTGRNLLTAYLHWKGMNYEDAIVVSESAAARLGSPGPLEVGDKLSNRHGAKGVVGAILPDDEMPHLPDGRAVDLLFDSMGVYSRLNFGQIIEAVLGLVAARRGEPVVAAPFRRTTPEELHAMLREAGLPDSGQFALRDGKDGPQLDEPSTVGIVYWGKLVHLARGKIRHPQSPGDVFRGMMSGRNEYLALRAVGASENILDAYLTRAVAGEEADALRRAAAQGFLPAHAEPPSPAFRRLQQALRTGMIALAWGPGKVTASWAEPEEPDVALAEPLEHPWRAGRRLTHFRPARTNPEPYAFPPSVRPVVELSAQLVEANERLADVIRSGAPEALREAARAALRRAAEELFADLLAPEDLGFHTRMQFTARGVLAPGYDLGLGQVGLPEDMAWALFGPLAAGEAGAEAVESRSPAARNAVEALMKDSVVIVNRAPTWEATCITAFTPVMVRDLCIHLHPLCCRMFNADFDGDMAAVWLPVTRAAQKEAREKLTIAAHLDRDPSVVMYHLAPSHAVMGGLACACESAEGRAAFEQLWPQGAAPPAPGLTRGGLVMGLLGVYEAAGARAALQLLEKLYALGVSWATRSGASFSPFAGEGISLPPPPASGYTASWDAYRAVADAEIEAQAENDRTMMAPMRAVRSGARGSVAALRATIGPWTVSAPYVPDEPIVHGFRDGLAPDELWTLVAKVRDRFQGLHESQAELAKALKLPAAEGASLLRRAMESESPGRLFAEAADANETDPLDNPDVRLWVGLPPETEERK